MFTSARSVASLLLSNILMMVGFGIAGYLLPVRALMEHWSTFDVALFGTGYTIGFTVSCIATPKLVMRVGHIRSFAILAVLLSSGILLCGLVIDPYAWVLFRFISGFGISGSYLVLESWMNERASNENRGTFFSLYLVTNMGGAVIGQYVVAAGDPATQDLFIVSGLIFALALLPIVISNAPSPAPMTQARFNVPELFRRSPVAVVGSFLAGAMAAAWLSLGSPFAQSIGLSTTEGATLLGAVLMGGAIAQFPLGRASDRMDRRLVMIFCGLLGLATALCFALVPVENHTILFFMAFLFGCALFPIYGLNVAHGNDLAKPDEYVEVSGGLMIVYGAGTIIGPICAGSVMSAFGNHALFLFIALLFGIYAFYAFWRIRQREAGLGLVGKTGFEAMAMPGIIPDRNESEDPNRSE
jgi:MFS family permease